MAISIASIWCERLSVDITTTQSRLIPDGATAMLDTLEASVLTHQAGGAPTDDTTILAVTWRGVS